MDRAKVIRVFTLMIFVFTISAMISWAAGTSSTSPSWGTRESSSSLEKEPESLSAVQLYDQGVAAHKKNDFKTALDLFEQALKMDRNNPDILNMLAHCQLKLGKIDDAVENYKKALRLRPTFPEAREYLGEAYVEAALREIKTLRGYGNEAAEELEDLVKALKDAAAQAE